MERNLVIVSLLVISLACLIIMGILAINENDIPDGFWSLVALPVGAIAGILVPSKNEI